MSAPRPLHGDERDRHMFACYFTKHIEDEDPWTQYELRNDIKAWCETLDDLEVPAHSLVREALALLRHLEAIDGKIEVVVELQLKDQLENVRHAKDAKRMSWSVVQPAMASLQQLAKLNNGRRRFLDKLGNRFAGIEAKPSWLQENLQWRNDRTGALDLDFHGQSYDEIKEWIHSEAKQLSTKPQPARAGAAIRKTPKRKVKGQYPEKVLRAADKIAEKRAKQPPPRGLGSGLMEGPLLTVAPPSDGYPAGVRPAKQPARWNARLQPPWHLARNLRGGMDMTSLKLFVRTDENDTIHDRLVGKTVEFDNHEDFQWYAYWCGPIPKPSSNVNKLLPMEWYTQALAASQPESKYILNLRSHPRISLDNKMFRFYVEYAGHGDLQQVFNAYCVLDNGFVPVQFLVLVFKALVDAALILKKGNTSHEVDGWQEIVHCDIKLLNIFLEDSQDEHFFPYPRPKLADFGHAFLTSKDDPANPAFYNEATGTRGWEAPEMMQFVDGATGEPVHDFPLLSHTNVWGIGAVMRSLMVLDYGDEDGGDFPATYLQNDISKTSSYEPFDADTRQRYQWLCDRVQKCLLVHPEERPALEDLKADVDGLLDRMFGANGLVPGTRPERLLGVKDDDYKVGMAFDPPATMTIEEKHDLANTLQRWGGRY